MKTQSIDNIHFMLHNINKVLSTILPFYTNGDHMTPFFPHNAATYLAVFNSFLRIVQDGNKLEVSQEGPECELWQRGKPMKFLKPIDLIFEGTCGEQPLSEEQMLWFRRSMEEIRPQGIIAFTTCCYGYCEATQRTLREALPDVQMHFPRMNIGGDHPYRYRAIFSKLMDMGIIGI